MPVMTAAQRLSSDTGIPEEAQAVFDQFVSDEYASTVDLLLSNKYGQRDLIYSDEAISGDQHEPAIKAYLYSKWRYIAQCMEYLTAEYNPIENYQGTEAETTIFSAGERKGQNTNIYGQREDTHTEPEDSTRYTYGQHDDTITPGKKITDVTADKQTTTTENAPFESSDYFHKNKVTLEGQQQGGASKTKTETYMAPNEKDEYHYPERHETETKHYQVGANGYQVSDKKGQQMDVLKTQADDYTDRTERRFTRHGNLGVMTASQMLAMDDEFWKAFGWLDDLAHDLAVILAVTVWAV